MDKNRWQGWAMIAAAAVLIMLPSIFNKPEIAHHKIIVATEKMQDKVFSHAVILVVTHNAMKARGYKLNGIPGTAGSGGPVNPDRLAALHSTDVMAPGSIAMPDIGLMLTDGAGAEQLRQAMTPPKDIRFVSGFAGWGAGQLDREIKQGLWTIADFDRAAVFDNDPASLWDRIKITPQKTKSVP